MPRLLTYNVRRCLGLDGELSPTRIAEVIAAAEPDIVCLQELDVNRRRTGFIDQAQAIADALSMQMLFHATLRVMEEQYGNAILTPEPAVLVKAEALPAHGRFWGEPRGAMWATLRIGGKSLQLINTHLGLRRRERFKQIEALLGPEWLGHTACTGPVCLVGDFNTTSRSPLYRRIVSELRDVQYTLAGPRHRTYPSAFPVRRIDHVFIRGPVTVTRVGTVMTPLARIASDHLPLAVDFTLGATPGDQA
ncbi:endonuclease/exonuclease/phosphatase family protein [Rhodoligotrophos defluvii]|uniref:endonuclease/exonuclease/phosphatase family protein n=1 Tax=Rhodoligotrophos defluvii TaxID=2561934 RepID=UPI0010C9A4DB|nr:endonuclease/exonuclease/phosphatase family protein [Rhodoligotrophos defluvii]